MSQTLKTASASKVTADKINPVTIKGKNTSSVKEQKPAKDPVKDKKPAAKEKEQKQPVKAKQKVPVQKNKTVVKANTKKQRINYLHKTPVKHEIQTESVKKPKMYSQIQNDGFTQDYFHEIKNIIGGMIQTIHNRYIYIMEIFPTNFHQLPLDAQKSILNRFRRFPNAVPTKGQLICITEQTDVDIIKKNIYNACPNNSPEYLLEMRDDYLATIEDIAVKRTTNYRYFYVWEYEGEGIGIMSKDINDIYRNMMTIRNSLANILRDTNNMVANPEDPVLYTIDILYRFLNRTSYKHESSLERILRINNDYLSMGKKPNVLDYFSPRGLRANYSKEFMEVDGMYMTFLCIRDSGYPSFIYPDWLNQLMAASGMDIHFFMVKQPRKSTIDRLKKKININFTLGNQSNSQSRQEAHAKNIRKSSALLKKMEEGDDCFDCCTVLTMYGNDSKQLLQDRKQIMADFSSSGIQLEASDMNCEDFYTMTLPLLDFQNDIFKRNKRNFTSSAIKNTYCFTNYMLYDETDYAMIIGPQSNNMPCSIDRWSQNKYSNPHVTIIGTSGSGKSVTEMGMGNRDNILGIKTFYILPLKAHEYSDAVERAHGVMYDLIPGAENVPNIMELYPEMEIKDKNRKVRQRSLLTTKVTSLCMWFYLLSKAETLEKYRLSNKQLNRVNSMLLNLYNDFGITTDNDSIWEDKSKGIKKLGPIIGNWYKRLKEDYELATFADLLEPFVNGNFSNFNKRSNMDLSRNMIVFNVSRDEIGTNLLPAIMYIAFDTASGIIKADRDHYYSLYLDEVWMMLYDSIIGESIEEQIRVLRGYGGSVITASQQIGEFIENRSGNAIMANSSIKILMKMDEKELALVAKYISLDSDDIQYLESAKSGDMLIICNGSKTRCHFALSIDELIAYETDPQKKEKLITKKKEIMMMKKLKQ